MKVVYIRTKFANQYCITIAELAEFAPNIPLVRALVETCPSKKSR